MIRAFFDANVVVVAIGGRSESMKSLIERWRKGEYELVLSEYVLSEVEAAWKQPYWSARLVGFPRHEALQSLRTQATIVEDYEVLSGIASHRADDDIVSAALAADVDFLVTRDKELRSYSGRFDFEIVDPSAFLVALEQEPRS